MGPKMQEMSNVLIYHEGRLSHGENLNWFTVFKILQLFAAVELILTEFSELAILA